MSIRDELVGGTAAACKLCAYLAGQSTADQVEWHAALALPVENAPHVNVVEALKRRGVPISERSVRRHRTNHEG